MTVASALYSALINADIPVVGSKIYKDIAPPASEFPYITYSDRLADGTALTGDSNVLARNHLMQVDLWEKRTSENVSIYEALAGTLENLSVTDGNRTIFKIRLYDTQRIVEFDDDNVHHAFSLNVYRKV